jgi:hypothetical protein
MQLDATIGSETYSGAFTAQCGAHAVQRNLDAQCLYEGEPEGVHCVRGLLFAFGFEIATALCVLGVWQLAHLAR